MKTAFPSISHNLIAGCIKNNRDSQKKFYDLLSPVIYRKILNAGFDHRQAEEVSTKVFIAIFNRFDQYDPNLLLEYWVLKVYDRVVRLYREEDDLKRNFDFKPSVRREKRDSLQ